MWHIVKHCICLRLCYPTCIKNPSANARYAGSILGLGRFPGGEHGNPVQYFLPREAHRQRRLAGYSHRVTKSWTLLNNITCMHAHNLSLSLLKFTDSFPDYLKSTNKSVEGNLYLYYFVLYL